MIYYDITAGNPGGAFALDVLAGRLVVGAALDHATTASYTLTVQASTPQGAATSVTVTVTVTEAE